jgi:hypothetical protein
MDQPNEQSSAEAVTETAEQTNTQATSDKTYTQKEVDDMMARLKSSVTHKALKPYEELGDPEQLRALVQREEQRKQEEAVKRGEFETVLQELAAKKDQEIARRDQVITEYKVTTPLLNAAAKYNSVNPEQVRSLLATNVKLDENGEPVVLDPKGSVRYDDDGRALSVDVLVKEFLDENPHFVRANPGTTNAKSANPTSGSDSRVDFSKLDMKNPEHRALYAKARGITR